MIKAWITDDIVVWESVKQTAKMFNKSPIVRDNKNLIEFADGEKLIKINPLCIEESCCGCSFDNIHYVKDIITYKDIKVGMLLVHDLDGFMLGNRWLVEEKRNDGSFYCKAHSCGKRSEWVCSDLIIDKESQQEFWYQKYETLEHWQKKFQKINGKIVI